MSRSPFRIRRGTAASWTARNPTLGAGELGGETDSGKIKLGNGSTAWASLPYVGADGGGGGGGSVSWGGIGGDLSDQTDLQEALDGKAAAATAGNATFLSGEITTTVSTNTTYAALGGSSITVEAGKTYEIRYRLRTYAAANTTGIRARRVLGGGAAGTVLGMHYLMMSNATAVIGQSSREGTNDPGLGLGTATSTTTASGTYWVDALFVCTTGGTFGLEVASEVAASSTVDGDGSYWTAIVRTTA